MLLKQENYKRNKEKRRRESSFRTRPPAKKAKEKPDKIPLPNDKKEKKEIIKKNRTLKKFNLKFANPQNLKKEIIDTNQMRLN